MFDIFALKTTGNESIIKIWGWLWFPDFTMPSGAAEKIQFYQFNTHTQSLTASESCWNRSAFAWRRCFVTPPLLQVLMWHREPALLQRRRKLACSRHADTRRRSSSSFLSWTCCSPRRAALLFLPNSTKSTLTPMKVFIHVFRRSFPSSPVLDSHAAFNDTN